MIERHVNIEVNLTGPESWVLVDGVDWSHRIQSITIEQTGNRRPVVALVLNDVSVSGTVETGTVGL